jgi:hypothetical protein
MKPKITLVAISDTTLKAMPVPVDMLPLAHKKILKDGDILEIVNQQYIHGHLVFECFDPNYLGKWYADATSVEITKK